MAKAHSDTWAGRRVDPRERFMNWVSPEPNTGGGLREGSYGGFGWRGKTWLAHRAAYTLFVGPIPDGKQLDHKCRQRLCVNPQHLEAVTARENVLRSPIALAAVYAKRKICDCGLPLVFDSKLGYRICSVCAPIRFRVAWKKYSRKRRKQARYGAR